MTHVVDSKLRIAPVSDIKSAARAIEDIAAYLTHIMARVPIIKDDPPASGIVFVTRDSDGHWHTYEVIAGTDITLTLDENAQTLTIETP